MTGSEHPAKRQKKPSNAPERTQKKQRRQQKYRRSNTLIQKAYELSTMADVDVFLGIRDRTTGRIKTFCSDDKTGFWSSRMEHLVDSSLSIKFCLYCKLTFIENSLPYSRAKRARRFFFQKEKQKSYLNNHDRRRT